MNREERRMPKVYDERQRETNPKVHLSLEKSTGTMWFVSWSCFGKAMLGTLMARVSTEVTPTKDDVDQKDLNEGIRFSGDNTQFVSIGTSSKTVQPQQLFELVLATIIMTKSLELDLTHLGEELRVVRAR